MMQLEGLRKTLRILACAAANCAHERINGSQSINRESSECHRRNCTTCAECDEWNRNTCVEWQWWKWRWRKWNTTSTHECFLRWCRSWGSLNCSRHLGKESCLIS